MAQPSHMVQPFITFSQCLFNRGEDHDAELSFKGGMVSFFRWIVSIVLSHRFKDQKDKPLLLLSVLIKRTFSAAC